MVELHRAIAFSGFAHVFRLYAMTRKETAKNEKMVDSFQCVSFDDKSLSLLKLWIESQLFDGWRTSRENDKNFRTVEKCRSFSVDFISCHLHHTFDTILIAFVIIFAFCFSSRLAIAFGLRRASKWRNHKNPVKYTTHNNVEIGGDCWAWINLRKFDSLPIHQSSSVEQKKKMFKSCLEWKNATATNTRRKKIVLDEFEMVRRFFGDFHIVFYSIFNR